MIAEENIRQIVQDEISKNYRSGAPLVPPHQHNGNDNLKISQTNIIPGFRTSGSITFAHIGDYVLNIGVNPNPTLILCYGIVINKPTPGQTRRAFTFGSAELGQSYSLQPQSADSVKTGGPLQSFIQSSSYISVDNAGNVKALTDGQHLVDVEDSSIHARLSLKSFNQNSITLTVNNLDTDWQIIVNLVVI